MPTIAEELQRAIRAQSAGQMRDAESIYRQLLDADPLCADAWHLLGVVCHQTGRSAEAAEHISRSLKLNPTFAHAHNNLGSVLMALGRRPEAVLAFRRAAQLDDTNVSAHRNLGFALKEAGDGDAACAAFERVLALRPDDAKSLAELARLRTARALTIDPPAPSNDHALNLLEQAVQRDPGDAVAHAKLANALLNQGQIRRAIQHYELSIKRRPGFAIAHHNLGTAFKALGRLEEALHAYQTAASLDENYVDAFCDLGTVLLDLEQFEAAEAAYRRAIALDPNCAKAFAGLGYVLKDRAECSDSLASYRQVVRLKPHDAEALGDLLLVTQYVPGVTAASLAQAHREYEQNHAARFRGSWTTRKIPRNQGSRLRIGFVSPDLGIHPVGRLLLRGFERFNRAELEIICYSDRRNNDELTARFRGASDAWHNTLGWTDERLDTQIRNDQIDILYDLAGHTSRNRMLVFARKPAPVQVSWLGYEGTTGLSAFDFILGDRFVIQPEAERFYPERVLRFPETYVCFDPPKEAGPVGELPALSHGFVTFGCFNNPAKLNADVIATWAQILRQTPRSRLMLKYRALLDNATQSRLRSCFASHGIGDERLIFEGRSPYADYLAAYGKIDIALDPFPFTGGVTTCEALWMGAPVLTCPGQSFAGRHSLSYLSAIGLTEWIAPDRDAYIAQAVAWSNDLPRLAEVRRNMRERMINSPLLDGELFARDFLAIQRDIEREHAQ